MLEQDELLFAPESEEIISVGSTSSELIRNNIDSLWKILIVDDEPQVHKVTELSLRELVFQNKPLKFLQAYSAFEAMKILKDNNDISLALVDVVMETNDSGLKLVEYVRKELKNSNLRIILRTGQPGFAPEHKIIIDYDINDYKEKSELTSQKLFTAVITALRTFEDLNTIAVQKEKLQIANIKNLELIEQLEKKVEERTEAIRDLLDNSDQGFLSFGFDFKVNKEYSRQCTNIFGCDVSGKNILELLFPDEWEEYKKNKKNLSQSSPVLLAEQLFIECFFDSSVSGNKFLSLLSKEYNLNDKTLSIKFLFLPGEHKTNPRIMLTVTDITLQKSMEIEKNQQNDINKILSKMAFDKKGCLEFLRDLYYEINKLSDIIEKDSFTLKTIKKIYMSVHTLKGNCSFYELSKIVSAAHILEESFSELLEKNIIPDTKMRSELIEKAKTLSAAFFENIGLLEEYISFDEILSDNDIFEINSSRINDLIKTAEKNNINTELLNKIYNLKKISVKKALARYTSNAEQIAVRLNKLILPIEIINHEMLIDASYFKPVLDIISHIIKNAVSHGIEYPEERLLKNKNKFGKITIDFSEIITNEQRSVKLIISDDGKGFMLDVLGKKLIEKKILTENEITEDKIIETIICGGTSSKEKADEFSGRGIGLAAIKNIIDQFNGTLTIKTEKDKGAEVIIIIPEILKP